ncbi:protein FAM219B [Brachyhypopomus gauderio]|uniref:protein FAM219B n=1 Tax=Brachyhypopomus gauderio TaxID=698409 RepID=UPI004041EFA3
MNNMEEQETDNPVESSRVTAVAAGGTSRPKPILGGGHKAVEKRGPYLMSKVPDIHMKLQKHREMAKRVLKKKGKPLVQPPRLSTKNVKFNKGYAALSQDPEDTMSLGSDSDVELEQYSSGYSSAEVHPEVSRQLMMDGYRLDEIPDDEDLDLVPPKTVASSICCCLDRPSCSMQ